MFGSDNHPFYLLTTDIWSCLIIECLARNLCKCQRIRASKTNFLKRTTSPWNFGIDHNHNVSTVADLECPDPLMNCRMKSSYLKDNHNNNEAVFIDGLRKKSINIYWYSLFQLIVISNYFNQAVNGHSYLTCNRVQSDRKTLKEKRNCLDVHCLRW